jgi:hypothetical protein
MNLTPVASFDVLRFVIVHVIVPFLFAAAAYPPVSARSAVAGGGVGDGVGTGVGVGIGVGVGVGLGAAAVTTVETLAIPLVGFARAITSPFASRA